MMLSIMNREGGPRFSSLLSRRVPWVVEVAYDGTNKLKLSRSFSDNLALMCLKVIVSGTFASSSLSLCLKGRLFHLKDNRVLF